MPWTFQVESQRALRSTPFIHGSGVMMRLLHHRVPRRPEAINTHERSGVTRSRGMM